MDQKLTNLFAKYQNNVAFSSRPCIASVHDLGLMDETLLNLAVIKMARTSTNRGKWVLRLFKMPASTAMWQYLKYFWQTVPTRTSKMN